MVLLVQIQHTVDSVSQLDVIIRIGLATLFGAIVGWERSLAEKPAGARTVAMIAAGAAAFALMGVQIGVQTDPTLGHRLDPTRVLSYIISGVGFLGAGAILHSKKSITGLTTASAIWAAAGIGAACGLGLFVIASALFVVVFCVLWLPWLGVFLKDSEDEPDADAKS